MRTRTPPAGWANSPSAQRESGSETWGGGGGGGGGFGRLAQSHPRQQKDSNSTRSGIIQGLEYCRDQAKVGLYSQLPSPDAI